MCASADLKVETISGEGDIKRMLCRQREHMEKTVSDLRTKLAKSAEEHEKAYVRIMKVKQKDFLINPSFTLMIKRVVSFTKETFISSAGECIPDC